MSFYNYTAELPTTIPDNFHNEGGGGGGGGTTNYNELSNKPSIAGVTLSGNKTLAQLGIPSGTAVANAQAAADEALSTATAASATATAASAAATEAKDNASEALSTANAVKADVDSIEMQETSDIDELFE